MQIELIGCTSAGKSTLARRLVQAGREQGINIWMDEDFVLKQARLNWVKSRLVQTLCLDIFSLIACLLTWRNNHKFYLFALRIILRLPATVSLFEKLNIARNVFKKIGMYEIIRRYSSDQQIVLVDEGTLHAAHYLFVHVSVQPNASELATFAKLAPLPEAAIYVTQRKPVLIARTLARRHRRIPNYSYSQVELFIKRAIETFDKLIQHLVLASRAIAINERQNIICRPNYQRDAALKIISEIFCEELEAKTAPGLLRALAGQA